jgi:hypothetical protein
MSLAKPTTLLDPISCPLHTILLVEDEDIVRDVTCHVLEHEGYRVLASGSPQQALELVRERPETLDLMLTDVVMPGMSGTELATRVAALRPGIAVLFMSGYTECQAMPEKFRDTMRDFLPKPFTMESLLGAVRRILGRKVQEEVRAAG